MRIELHAKDPQVDANPEVREWLEHVARAVERRISEQGGFNIVLEKNMNPFWGWRE